MPSSYYMPMEVFNGIVLVLFALLPTGILIATARPGWGEHLTYRASVRARLPISSERMAQVLAARTRKIVRANMWGMLAAMAVVASMFVLVPLGVDPNLIWVLALAVLLGTMVLSEVVLTLRERVFAPAPTEPRVARADALTVGDYLDPVRRFTPLFLFVGTVIIWIAIAVVAVPSRLEPSAIGLLMLVSVIAIVGMAAGRRAEARVLDQPQPASSSLGLAWDDLVRADALGTLRMAQSVLLWLPIGMTLPAIFEAFAPASPGLSTTIAMLPWIGIPVIQLTYNVTSGRLPRRLQPDRYDAGMPGEGKLT